MVFYTTLFNKNLLVLNNNFLFRTYTCVSSENRSIIFGTPRAISLGQKELQTPFQIRHVNNSDIWRWLIALVNNTKINRKNATIVINSRDFINLVVNTHPWNPTPLTQKQFLKYNVNTARNLVWKIHATFQQPITRSSHA